MIKSMTGFGRGEYSDENRNITVEIRSVNHRYGDINIRMPRRYSFAEEKIRSEIKKVLLRGKIEVSIMMEDFSDTNTNIRVNKALAKKYYDSFVELNEEFDLEEKVTLELLSTQQDVIKALPNTEDEEEIVKCILIPVKEAVKSNLDMRMNEGEKLYKDVLSHGEIITELVNDIEKRAPEVSKDYADKLRARITSLLSGEIEIPEERILSEAAIFADKSNIDEEIVRLKSHIGQVKAILDSDKTSIGKRLDFLVQEMNREANTIGSKANDISITNKMLEAKSEIEKIREQVQNIE
ncbi:MAG TPA: YicC/YloC family endoribonuclease [Anaerovoracaceae bacterium]|nr:YicC/YloC family endoribonuclease [Anaerovoracaceae bacterium]